MTEPAFTEAQLKNCLPAKCRNAITPEFVTRLNGLADPEIAEQYRENFYDYHHILKEGRYKLQDYANAVRFVTYRLMDLGIVDSYSSTFPDKYHAMVEKGRSRDFIASIASAYNKNKLVSGIFEQSLIPTHLANAHIHQEAINVLAKIIGDDDASYRSKIDAANSLLTNLKGPETAKLEVSVTNDSSSALEELRKATNELAAKQKMMLDESVVTTQEVADSIIIPKIINED